MLATQLPHLCSAPSRLHPLLSIMHYGILRRQPNATAASVVEGDHTRQSLCEVSDSAQQCTVTLLTRGRNETQDNSRTPTATQSRLTLSAATASLRKHLPNRHNKHKRGSLHSFISDPATARSSTEGPETLFSRNSHDTEMLHLAPDVPLPTSPIDVPTHAPALTLNLGPPAFMLPTFQPSDPNDIAIGTPVDSHMHVAPESVNTAHEDCPAYEDYPTSSPATPTSLMRLSTDESRLAALLSSPMPGM